MIKKDRQTLLEFGKGDVDLFVSYDENHSLVVMENASTPREIGVWKDSGSEDFVHVNESSVIMSFSNTRSIDAVICALTKAKEAFNRFCVQAVAE